MKLVDNWWRVLLRAWSSQLNFLQILVGFGAYLIPAIQDSVSPWALVLIICVFSLLSLVVKPIKQQSVSGPWKKERRDVDQ